MMQSKLRNLFDQYHQPENQVTNALLQTLETSDELKKRFFEKFVRIPLKRNSKITLQCQKIPGEDENKPTTSGSVPDGLITDAENSIAVAIESKIGQDAINEKQLIKHLQGIKEYKTHCLLVITPDAEQPKKLDGSNLDKEKIVWHSWQEIYEWVKQEIQNFSQDGKNSDTATKYLLKNLGGFMSDKGLTRFDGFRDFEDDKKTKEDFKVLCDEITGYVQGEYSNLGHNPKSTRNPKKNSLWTVIGEENHVTAPHFTLGLNKAKERFVIALYIPHRATKYWTRLERIFTQDEERLKFIELLKKLRKQVSLVELELIHRHAEVGQKLLSDGELNFDIDTAITDSTRHHSFKKFPHWFFVMEELIKNKSKSEANIQFGVCVCYRFDESNKELLAKKGFMEEVKNVMKNFKEMYEFFCEGIPQTFIIE